MQKPKRSKLKKITRLVLWILLAQFVLLNISASFYAHRLTHFYHASELSSQKNPGNIFSKTWKLFTGPRIARSPVDELPVFDYETVQLTTKRGIRIEAWYAAADSTKGTVILLHGITSNKSHLLPQANEFLFMGYNIMLVDLRGHGNSGGEHSSVGVRESEELRLAYDYAVKRTGGDIFLYGISLGAVIVAKAASENIKPAGLILEMPFGSLHDHLQARARTVGFPEEPFGFLVTLWTGIERGYNGFKHRTTSYAAGVECPVLLQWGAEDDFVLKKETDTIFESLASSRKKLVVYENAGHGILLFHDPVKWRSEVGEFLNAN